MCNFFEFIDLLYPGGPRSYTVLLGVAGGLFQDLIT